MAASITGDPITKLTGIQAPTRNGTVMTFKWGVPGDLTNSSSGRRAEWVDMWITFHTGEGNVGGLVTNGYIYSKGRKVPLPLFTRWYGQTFDVSKLGAMAVVWHRGYPVNNAERSLSFNRQKYHPIVANKFLKYVYAHFKPGNSRGDGFLQSTPYFTFVPPAKPSIPAAHIVEGTNAVATTIKHEADGTHNREYYDTMYAVTRQDNYNALFKTERHVLGWDPTKKVGKWVKSSARATEINVSYDPQATTLEYNQWQLLRFKAYSRGIAGNTDVVVREFMYAHPPVPTITAIKASGKGQGAVITIAIKTNASRHHPVWKVTLDHAVTAHTVTDPHSIETWSTAAHSMEDNAACAGFTETVTDSGLVLYDGQGRPNGNKLWYRVHTEACGFHNYSVPVEAKCLTFPPWTADTSTCTIESVSDTPGEEGLSATVRAKWTASVDRNTTDTEVSWSDEANAWDSTTPPQTFTVDRKALDSQDSKYYCDLVVKGLEEGVTYYFRARRHGTDANGEDVYGPYSEITQFTPTSAPANVVLNGPDYVARGESIPLTWTFDGSEQTEWTVNVVNSELDPATGLPVSETGDTIVKRGSDALGSAVLTPEEQRWTDGVMVLRVGVTSGGSWAYSTPKKVSVMDAPTAELSVSGLDQHGNITSQPLSFSVTSNSQSAVVVAKLRAKGITVEEPDGLTVQAAGDAVWSDLLEMVEQTSSGDAEAGTDTYVQPFTAPSELALYDTGAYELSVVVVDSVSGLASEEAVAEFSVDYDHKPEPPSQATFLNAVKGSKAVSIRLVADPSNLETDRADIYRVTPEGVYPVATNVRFGSTVLDRYAPYSKTVPTYYRVANRTVDGSVAWRDFQYSLPGFHIRFDWDDKFVELPYNIKYSSTWSKDFEARDHMDESKPTGMWNQGVSRTSSLSTDIVRLEDPEVRQRIFELAQYAGPVYVRTPDGAAYVADVQVTSLPNDYDSLVQTVSFKATEIAQSGYFTASSRDVNDPEEQEEG